MTNLTGRVAIVTGGANGMGEATAHLLAHRGGIVVIADKDSERAPLVADAINEKGGQAVSIVTDVSEAEQVDALVRKTLERYGRIDALDNNAAALELVGQDHDVLDLEPEILFGTLKGTLVSAYLMTRAVLPAMLEQGGGAIVNMASLAGMWGQPRQTAYGIAKAGLIQFTRSVAIQYGRSGIRCNAIAPTFVRTRNTLLFAPPGLTQLYERALALPETPVPEDIAEVVVFLLSDAARMITGHLVPVDGGTTANSQITADYREWMESAGVDSVLSEDYQQWAQT
jgi:NAD(P)-dependent dehydrogenase (short-subunit alcohol dehydrogenase family)